LVVAALALYLAREPEPVAPSPPHLDSLPEQRIRHSPLLRAVLIGTALSGAASFAYEIIWIRMLSMAVGSTMHAFELMLASFIAGIAFGGLWVRKRADATSDPLLLVGWMQIFMGVAALASLAVYANAFAWVGWLMQSLAKPTAATRFSIWALQASPSPSCCLPPFLLGQPCRFSQSPCCVLAMASDLSGAYMPGTPLAPSSGFLPPSMC